MMARCTAHALPRSLRSRRLLDMRKPVDYSLLLGYVLCVVLDSLALFLDGFNEEGDELRITNAFVAILVFIDHFRHDGFHILRDQAHMIARQLGDGLLPLRAAERSCWSSVASGPADTALTRSWVK